MITPEYRERSMLAGSTASSSTREIVSMPLFGSRRPQSMMVSSSSSAMAPGIRQTASRKGCAVWTMLGVLVTPLV